MAIEDGLRTGGNRSSDCSSAPVVRMPKEKTLLLLWLATNTWLPVLSEVKTNRDSARCHRRIRRDQRCKVAGSGVDRELIDRAHSICGIGNFSGLLNDNPCG